jgi:CspA family cold shock protein
MVRGTVDFVNDSTGSGFIASEDLTKDVLFLSDDVEESELEAGVDVEFEVVETEEGPRAIEVRQV